MTGLAVHGGEGRELPLAPPARRRHGRWSTPARIRTQAVAIAALACCLAALAAVLLAQLRGDFQAIGQRDLIVVQSVVVILVFAVVTVTFLVDLSYVLANPRLRAPGAV